MATRTVRKTATAGRAAPAVLKDLFSYRLNRLAHVSSRIAAGLNESRYGVGPREWRIVALLGAAAPMSLNALARESNIDKSQASRTVAELIDKKLIRRSADAEDGRGISLDLTAAGRRLYQEMFPAAVERNESLLQVLTATERDVLERALDKLTARALEMFHDARAEIPTRRGRSAGPR
ncbi:MULTISPECIES: MarR family winged helix-turn-helix transcriptional regulator [Bordetella]|uniref:MarR family transcriptional regulator n=2 Tax=Bordetella TaxID=517 RepID=A0A261VRZ6_9BORD|nr:MULTISPECIES: MarR family winged helix-turn-helix transcriptional regulator [Bordetella]MDM9560712.1 MarR family winged helix-turn-helix transcriptional regulator [Bordetella petrii]OZI76561.1 MarR family transcriptional regulator [Bordetella genomosp. 2]